MTRNQIQQRLQHAARHSTHRDLEFLQAAAADGVVEAQMLLAKKYHSGIGVQHDYRSAERLYLRAVRQGEADAMYHLKRMFIEDTKRAKARACAERYRSGIAVQLDYRSPKQLLRAARKSESDANRHLIRGNAQAAKMKKAGDRAADATYHLERMYHGLGIPPERPTGPKRTKRASKKGHSGANRKPMRKHQLPMKTVHKRKSKAMRRDHRSAKKLHLCSVKQGKSDAMYHLEGVLIEGKKRAMARARGEAQRLLADKYRSSKMVQLDNRSQKQLLHTARQSETDAKHHLKGINIQVAKIEKARARAADAAYHLERIHQGLGIPLDRPTVSKKTKKAADGGHSDVNRKLDERRKRRKNSRPKRPDRYPRRVRYPWPGSTASADH